MSLMHGDSSKRLKVILLNVPLLLIIVLFLASGISYRLKNEFWSEMIGSGPRLYYNIIATLVICYALVASVGILRMKEWGRMTALSLYSIVAFMFIGTKLFVVFSSPMVVGDEITYSLLWREQRWYPEYGAGFYCLIMIAFLLREEVKIHFDKQGV